MIPKRKRLYALASIFLCGGGLALFLGIALQKNIRFFVTPRQIMEENITHHKHLRLGGIVKEKSLQQNGLASFFIVTDGTIDIPVHYIGLLPDLFREGQTIIAEGSFNQDTLRVFEAKTILAKHDENYRPPDMKQKP